MQHWYDKIDRKIKILVIFQEQCKRLYAYFVENTVQQFEETKKQKFRKKFIEKMTSPKSQKNQPKFPFPAYVSKTPVFLVFGFVAGF